MKNPKDKTKVGYVALIGRPNAGKSTLLNKILGQKVAIISDKPQTTRTSILGIKTAEEGQILFTDNPGIHKPLHRLNRRMMNIVYSALETSDLVCLLIDATLKFGHGDQFVIDTLQKVTTPVFLLINKVDITKKDKVLLLIDKYKDLYPFAEIIPVSALKGINMDDLEKSIFKYLPEAEKIYADDDITVQSDRFLISEIIREKLLSHVQQELPFVTAVYIDEIENRKSRQRNGTLLDKKYIKAHIFVEKEGHRRIIIGRRGSLVKTIGTEARKEIEEIFEMSVFLDLHVKVKERWRDTSNVLELIDRQ